MAIKIDRFNELLENANDFRKPRIKTSVPSPDDGDYNVGYITRYFIQSANDKNGYVYEVNQTQFSSYINNPFFKTVELDWKISGDIDEVREMNRKSVRFASNDLKAILLYLPNYLQFHK